jgi:phosphate:Na+ symporter
MICIEVRALAVEAVRRTVARAFGAVCRSPNTTLAAASRGETLRPEKGAASEAAEALRQAQVFMSDVDGPPESDDEQRRLTSTLHSLDHAFRLAEMAGQEVEFSTVNRGPKDVRAAHLWGCDAKRGLHC